MIEDLTGFEVLVFPDELNLNKVYVIYIERHGKRIPIYVGQTTRGYERFRDYLYPDFKASTDFKVGEAINYLTKNGFKIFIYHKNTKNGKDEEKEMIMKFKNRNFPLLNDLKGYDYKQADENSERINIQRFIDTLIHHHFNLKKN